MSDSATGALDLRDATAAAFAYHKLLADRAVAQLPDAALRRTLDAHTNSIAVIMQHVAGNLRSRWTDFLTSDGEKPWRHRDDEFVDRFPERAALLEYWEAGWAALTETLAGLTAADMTAAVTIRGETFSVPAAMARSLAHTSYHVGQIVQLARHWAGDQWETLTIPRGGSSEYNKTVWGEVAYGQIEPPQDAK